MKKIIVQFNLPNVSSKTFDKLWEDARNAGYAKPKGLLHHVAGPNGNDWLVVDTWESAEQFEEFGKVLMPIMSKHGITNAVPKISPVHFEYVGERTATQN